MILFLAQIFWAWTGIRIACRNIGPMTYLQFGTHQWIQSTLYVCTEQIFVYLLLTLNQIILKNLTKICSPALYASFGTFKVQNWSSFRLRSVHTYKVLWIHWFVLNCIKKISKYDEKSVHVKRESHFIPIPCVLIHNASKYTRYSRFI